MPSISKVEISLEALSPAVAGIDFLLHLCYNVYIFQVSQLQRRLPDQSSNPALGWYNNLEM